MTLTGKLGRFGAVALALALLVTGGFVFANAANAQSPQSVPSARFYGTARNAAGAPIAGGGVVATIGGVQCGVGSADNSGNYFVDIQAAPGCTTPGATVSFTLQGQAATPSCTPTLPNIEGSAVHCDLSLKAVATATRTPPPLPPSPTRTATVTPPTPPTVTRTIPPTVTHTPVVTATRPVIVPTIVQVQTGKKAVQQQAPRGILAKKGPVVVQTKKAAAVQAPSKAVSVQQAPVYRAPVSVQQAPAAVSSVSPKLPNTGTGGLLNEQSSGSALAGWAVLAIVLAALGISATGAFAYRRSR